MRRALVVSLLLASVARADREIAGVWSGTLEVPGGARLRIVFRIEKGADDGALTTTMDSPDQGAHGIPIRTTRFDAATGTLTLELPDLAASFSGTLDASGDVLKGAWKQGGLELTLTMRRGEAAAPRRPQEPKPPFPYVVEEVRYAGGAEGVMLAGTLTRPEGDGPCRAVLLITGSGPQNRNEELFGHKPFLVLADHLTRKGIAVLRVDDRGVGGSTGAFAGATSLDFANDARAGVRYLAARPEVAQVGVVGHSEGGVIAAIVASDEPQVAFAVLLAGTGVPGDAILQRQRAAIQRAAGVAEAQIELSRRVHEKLFRIVAEESDDEQALDRMEAAIAAEKEIPAAGRPAYSRDALRQLVSPWFRHFLTLDPRTYLRKVRCPVLALNGEMDLQVLPDQNLPEIAKALREAGNEAFATRELKGLNHLFQHCETGAVTEYGTIEETFAEEALAAVAAFILER